MAFMGPLEECDGLPDVKVGLLLGERLPRIQDAVILETERGREDVDAFDLEWLPQGAEFAERILLRWGAPASTRA